MGRQTATAAVPAVIGAAAAIVTGTGATTMGGPAVTGTTSKGGVSPLPAASFANPKNDLTMLLSERIFLIGHATLDFVLKI